MYRSFVGICLYDEIISNTEFLLTRNSAHIIFWCERFSRAHHGKAASIFVCMTVDFIRESQLEQKYASSVILLIYSNPCGLVAQQYFNSSKKKAKATILCDMPYCVSVKPTGLCRSRLLYSTGLKFIALQSTSA